MANYSAFFTGLILSVMIFFNGKLSASTSTYFSNVAHHGIGFLVFGLVVLYKERSLLPKQFAWLYIIPGILGSLTLILNNYIMNSIGITLMVAYGLLGQVVTSLIIDKFGLLGKPKIKTTPKQWIGILVMTVGLGIMIV